MSFSLPNSKKTKDPDYKEAKTKFHSYMMDSQKLITSIQNLGSQAVNIAKLYSKFCKTVSSWFPDSSEEVKQSMTSLVNSSNAFEELAVQKFVNTLNPSYKPAVDEYQQHIRDVLDIEKKRRSACKEYDEEREKLRKAQKSKDANQDKISHLQQSTDTLEQQYNKLNKEYIDSVNQFTEHRKTELLGVFKSSAAIICQFINESLKINNVPFPGSQAPNIVNGVLQTDDNDDIIIMDHNTLANRNNEANSIPPASVPTAGTTMPQINTTQLNQLATNSIGTASTSSSTIHNRSTLSTSSAATASYTPSTSYAGSPLQPANPALSPLGPTAIPTTTTTSPSYATTTNAAAPIPAATRVKPSVSQSPASSQAATASQENDASLSNGSQTPDTKMSCTTAQDQSPQASNNVDDDSDDDYMNMTNPFD